MGSNLRYPDHEARLAQERELREALKHGPLQTLTSEQIALHRDPLTIAPEHSRIVAWAWLRFGDTDVRTTVRIHRWTESAVGVSVEIDGKEHRAWIWQGACTPIQDSSF